jgi:hypothetical protein
VRQLAAAVATDLTSKLAFGVDFANFKPRRKQACALQRRRFAPREQIICGIGYPAGQRSGKAASCVFAQFGRRDAGVPGQLSFAASTQNIYCSIFPAKKQESERLLSRKHFKKIGPYPCAAIRGWINL